MSVTGAAYRARGPDGVVALKVVHPHLLATPGFFKRFLREPALDAHARRALLSQAPPGRG